MTDYQVLRVLTAIYNAGIIYFAYVIIFRDMPIWRSKSERWTFWAYVVAGCLLSIWSMFVQKP